MAEPDGTRRRAVPRLLCVAAMETAAALEWRRDIPRGRAGGGGARPPGEQFRLQNSAFRTQSTNDLEAIAGEVDDAIPLAAEAPPLLPEPVTSDGMPPAVSQDVPLRASNAPQVIDLASALGMAAASRYGRSPAPLVRLARFSNPHRCCATRFQCRLSPDWPNGSALDRDRRHCRSHRTPPRTC